MKYLELKTTKETKTAILLTGTCHELKDGSLIIIKDGVVKRYLDLNEWIKFDDSPQPSDEVHLKKDKILSRSITTIKLIPSNELKALVRSNLLTRPEVIKRLWAYIRKHDLQDKKNRRLVHVGKDPVTKAIFKRDVISMFEMAKAISGHLFYQDGKRVG